MSTTEQPFIEPNPTQRLGSLQNCLHHDIAKLMESERRSTLMYDFGRETVDAILASPEMHALRKALLHAAANAAVHAYPAARIDPTESYLRERCKLPDHVIEWVLS